jgi:hypothetical protein
MYDGIHVVGCNPNFDSAEQRYGKIHVAGMKILSFHRCSK